jgi:hypothetical protein
VGAVVVERWCRLGDVVWWSDDAGYCHTEFPDGARAIARPQDDGSYRDTARRLGYGDDTAAMSREHELCHSLLAYLAHLADPSLPPHSPALWDAAHGYGGGEDRHWEEEERVLAFQEWFNRGEDWPLYERTFRGCFPDSLWYVDARDLAQFILRGPVAPGCRIEVGVRGTV